MSRPSFICMLLFFLFAFFLFASCLNSQWVIVQAKYNLRRTTYNFLPLHYLFTKIQTNKTKWTFSRNRMVISVMDKLWPLVFGHTLITVSSMVVERWTWTWTLRQNTDGVQVSQDSNKRPRMSLSAISMEKQLRDKWKGIISLIPYSVFLWRASSPLRDFRH